MSRVFSIELDGISNACTTKVMMNKPVTNTAARDARNSTVVSFGFSSTAFLSTTSLFFATIVFSILSNACKNLCSSVPTSRPQLVYQPQRAAPARVLKQMCQRICESVSLAAARVFIGTLHRPVDQQRASDDVFPRYEAPIPAVLAVVAIVTHHKIMSLRNDEFAVLH